MTDTNAPAQVAIIVVTWNQRDLTLDCLASLQQQRYPNLETIVVDNGSTDGTADAVRAAYPGVVMIENGENLGFVGGNNAGLRYALQGDPEYLMLLNNDTALDPEMVNDLLAVMQADPTIGIAGPKMLYFDQPETIWCAGNRINWRTGDSLRLQAEQPDVAIQESPREVDFITGCAICLRREVIEQIGLLDSRFFIYYEETDWCVQARNRGWKILYVPQARLWHKVSATMGATSPATDYYMTRNAILFLAKNRQGLARLWSLSCLSAKTLRVMAAYTVKSRSHHRLRSRDARLLGIRDAILGRWGKMGPDVEQLCRS
jgi:GT2 family glycosyltransferase